MSIAEVSLESAFMLEARRRRRRFPTAEAARGVCRPRHPPNQTKPAPRPKCGKRHRGRVRADLINDSSLPLRRLKTTPGGPSHAQPFRTGPDGPHSAHRRLGGRDDRDVTRRGHLPDLWRRLRSQLSVAHRLTPVTLARLLCGTSGNDHLSLFQRHPFGYPFRANILYFVTATVRTCRYSALCCSAQ